MVYCRRYDGVYGLDITENHMKEGMIRANSLADSQRTRSKTS